MNKGVYLLGFCFSLAYADPSAKEVMIQNEARQKNGDLRSKATLVTGGNGAEKTKQFTWWKKLSEDGIHFNTLTRFHYPAEIKDEGILFLEHGNGQNEVLIYLPNFKKIRRVENEQQSGSFMGSEFSYSDLTALHVDDHSFKMLKEETCPGVEHRDVKCYVIESFPVSDSIKDRTGYSKVTTRVRQDNFMAVQADYTNLEGELFKKLDASEIKKVDPEKNTWMAHQIRVENLKTHRFTSLKFSDVKVNAGTPASTFTQQNLSRVP